MVKRNGEGCRGRGNGDEKELGGRARQGRKEEQKSASPSTIWQEMPEGVLRLDEAA